MDKVLSRNVIMCYRKLLSHHHHQCIRFKQLGSLQQVIAGGSQHQPRQCHVDASSKGSVQKGLIQEDNKGKRKEGGNDIGDNGLTPSPQNRSVQPQSLTDNQGNMTENSGDDTKPTGSVSIVEDSSSSLASSSSSGAGGSDKNDSLSDTSEKTLASDDEKSRRKEPPVAPDPETCCESGCVNCVWIKYAEEVKDYYPDGQDHQERLKEILDLIEDYNVKMFVRMELGIKK
ncbi:uncharacterized protein LOC105446534 [Strongylocentrotus purpuratus]|uniref:Oxidoreductase-like domain-containing protein n=1 Tax=Strongylocentrotus purpuratus TaxID=7668 RepID=A0A7M7LTZ0_STRPU|nr:uncharacterized protein LOC105446534 [Strongylocentrotus purpuratus]